MGMDINVSINIHININISLLLSRAIRPVAPTGEGGSAREQTQLQLGFICSLKNRGADLWQLLDWWTCGPASLDWKFELEGNFGSTCLLASVPQV